MRVRGINIKVLTCWHFIRERYFMTTQENRKKLSLRPLSPRDPEQPHRAATPLELLFDLILWSRLQQRVSSYIMQLLKIIYGMHYQVT